MITCVELQSKRATLAKSITEYFAIWQRARMAQEKYAISLDTEHLADEQFVVQQHAVAMMTQLQAMNDKEVRMKIQVALQEADFDNSNPETAPFEVRLMARILTDLDVLLDDEVPQKSLPSFS